VQKERGEKQKAEKKRKREVIAPSNNQTVYANNNTRTTHLQSTQFQHQQQPH
jgi:hypothetical protein